MNQKPNQITPEDLPSFDVDVLLGKCGIIMQREVRALMAASARGKLDRSDATDLINYIKLLADTKVQLEDAVKNLSDAELKAIK